MEGGAWAAGAWAAGACAAAGWAAMGVAVETGDTEADGELKPMGKFHSINLCTGRCLNSDRCTGGRGRCSGRQN